MSDVLRVAHVVGSLDPRFGGPSQALPALFGHLRAQGVEVEVVTTHGEEGPVPSEGFRLHSSRRKWEIPPYLSPELWRALDALLEPRAAGGIDLVHSHGLFLYANWAAGVLSHRHHRPFVVSPCGMAEPWALAQHRLPKTALWWALDGRHLRRATLVLPKSEAEAENLRGLGLGNVGREIANGVDLAQPENPGGLLQQHWPGLSERRYVLFVGRLHPKKGLLPLAQAWRALAPFHPGWKLVIAGPVSDERYLQQVAATLGGAPVVWAGAVYGDQKAALFAGAGVAVLPSFSENFGTTVAEALWSGVPVIASRATPWSELLVRRCGWWTDPTAPALQASLSDALGLPDEERVAMGARGRSWARAAFAWPAIAGRIAALYRELRSGVTTGLRSGFAQRNHAS